MNLQLGGVVLGGNVFGWTTSRDEAFAILDAFFDGGGRAIDTADIYPAWAAGRQGGESEAIIGEWLAQHPARRDALVIATKVGIWNQQPGLSAANIRAAIDGSLQRLRTDYVDIYYAHRDDLRTEQSEYLGAFDALVKAGKVRVLGASNFTAERLASALAHCRAHHLAAFECSQDHYNLVERKIEATLVPLLVKEHLVELPYYALASGFLTGKYRPGAHVDSARSDGKSPYTSNPRNLQLLDVLDEIARAQHVSIAAIALAWLRVQPAVGAPIASARTRDQLGPLLESTRVTLSAADVARLSEVTST